MKKRVFSLLLALTLLLCALPLPVHAAANEITVYNGPVYLRRHGRKSGRDPGL